MIGSQSEADQIAHWYSYAERHEDVPSGWKFLSWGTYRDVYLSPTNVVYKIQHYEYGEHEANLCEIAAIERGKRDETSRAWMPDARMYYCEDLDAPVIAMEYIDGSCELTGTESRIARLVSRATAGVSDLLGMGKEDNARRRPSGQPVLIDLGGYGNLEKLLSAA